jgi:hypothetical protein
MLRRCQDLTAATATKRRDGGEWAAEGGTTLLQIGRRGRADRDEQPRRRIHGAAAMASLLNPTAEQFDPLAKQLESMAV